MPAVPTDESIRVAMDEAWRDHHHARDQTWKALQMEAIVAAGLVSIDVQYHSQLATSAAAALVALTAIFGILISLHHRKLEILKLEHIDHCQQALGLNGPDLISGVKAPRLLRLRDVLIPGVRNTAVFILRMHFAILVFALLVASARWVLPAGAATAGSRPPAAAATAAARVSL